MDIFPFATKTRAFICDESNRDDQDHDIVATVFPDCCSILFNGINGVGVGEAVGVGVGEAVGVGVTVGVGEAVGVAVTVGVAVGVGVTVGTLVLDTV